MMATLRNPKFKLVGAALTIMFFAVAAGLTSNAGQNQQDQQQFSDQTSQQQGFSSGNQMGSTNQQDQQQATTQMPPSEQMGTQGRQDQQQLGTQAPSQQGYQPGGEMGTQPGMQGNRNQPLERRVAGQLRNQGLGQKGQLLVLAVGNRVILLGEVPDQNEKQRAEQIAGQIQGVGQVDNRIVVSSQARRRNDNQLQQDIQQQLSRLPSGAGQNIQVQARNGRVILRGQVNDWQDMADAIHAAFAAGAPYVVSQITTSGQMGRSYGSRMGTGQSGTQMDQGGYAAGQQNQSRSRYAADWQSQDRSGTSQSGQSSDYGPSSTDQYGQYGYQAPEDRTYSRTYDQDRDQDQQYDRYDSSRSQGGTDRGTSDQYSQSGGRTAGRDRWRQTSQDRRQEQRLTSELRSNVQGLEDVTVLVAGNKVFLFGRAQSQSAKDQATSLAQETSGIQRVQNDLIVSTGRLQRQDDSAIRSNITEELQASPHLSAERIRVSVRNGVATLSGRVDGFGEVVAAIQSAYQAGARSVRNRLTVSGMAGGRRGTEGGYQTYGYGTDQSSSGQYGTQGGYGTQGSSSQPYGGTSDQSTSGEFTTQGVAYRFNDDTSDQSMSGSTSEGSADQGDYFPSYGYTPSDADEDQNADEGEMTQGNRQSTSSDQFTPGSQQQRATGRQRMSTADMILAQRVALELQRQLTGGQIIHVLDPHAIYVTVNQGSVTLLGQVQDGSLKQQAEQIARSIRGVQTVQNQLLVAGQGSAFPPLGYVPGQQGSQQSTSSMGTGQRTTGQQMTASDRNLSQQIDQQIRQQLPGTNITVTVSQGTATLQGSVQDNSQKQQAEQIARSISGIQNVQNNLTASGQQPAFGRSTTGQPSTYGQSTTGQQPISRQPSSMGQTGFQQGSSSDKVLAHQIALELQQQLPSDEVVYVLDQQAINVLVTQGAVMLQGSVPDQNAKQQAEQIARSASGARNVQNALTIMGQSQRQAMGQQMGMGQSQQMGMSSTDRRLAQQVQQQLQQQLPGSNINVTISQGTATLQGNVQDQNQKQQAEQIAKSVSGVMSVQNNLTIGTGQGAFPPLGYTPGQENMPQQDVESDTGMGSSSPSQPY